eukprot:TRINITY_DN14922_c0_g1_i4.p1 TRINITY_DN14922_c0_g1~~TRINITY_DN14922_c0_g1_i4.p1  ORF type:complete len:1098 (+),score=235.69 TRINITY_DN14922_c0_g1_i4:589-3882(+)
METDLAHHNPFTTALRSLGRTSFAKQAEPTVKVYKGEEPLSCSKLEKEYEDWVFQMHEKYDEEIECGEDQPVIVLSPSNKKGLGISSDVVRVHRVIKRKGASWKSGQKIKVLKGAVGCYKNNLYATLEYILLEGFQGDSGGEARLICRPLGCPDRKGCLLEVNGENASLDIKDSLSFPISVIDSGKCQAIDTAAWNYQLEKMHQKAPSAIEILNVEQCHQLEMEGALPCGSQISAGFVPPNEIVAVVRPFNFTACSSSKGLDPKYIVKDDLEMSMEIKYTGEGKDCQGHLPIDAEHARPSSRKGFGGLYIFPLGYKFPKLFHKCGVYKFCFSICSNSSCKKLEAEVVVQPSSRSGKWAVLCDRQGPYTNGKSLMVRVGSCVPHLSIAFFDEFYNRRPFKSIPDVNIKIITGRTTLVRVVKMVMDLCLDKKTLQITDMLIESSELDLIRPHYRATLEISSHDELFCATVPCQVIPGYIDNIKMKRSQEMENGLLPGSVVMELILELFDAYGNHVEKGLEVHVDVDGFCFQDYARHRLKVDDHGCVNLSGLLKVTGGYGKLVYLSVHFDGKLFFKKEFQVVQRELRIASVIPGYCVAGSQLENIIFEVTDSEGVIDEGIHDEPIQGHFHTLLMSSESSAIDNTIRYTFHHGRCTVPVIPVPREEGTFHFVASHSHHSELHIGVEVSIIRAPKLELVTVTPPDADVALCNSSNDNIFLLPDASVHHPSRMQTFVESVVDGQKKLENTLAEAALQIGSHEKQLKVLEDQMTEICQEIYNLQASMDLESPTQLDYLMNAKEEIVKRIEGKGDNAAAVFCNLSKGIQLPASQKHIINDMLGLVALLGSVNNSRLSRIFAEYLGEDYMLAIVSKSYETARVLESYSENGEVNHSLAFHEAAVALGKTINRRFLVICLEEIRPYSGWTEGNDPQKKLSLPDPCLPSGKVPPGFLGYAVNMINIDLCHLYIKTSTGHGLRETLFYLLFGELQVYKTREDMQRANVCIKSGAVSLDGGIMKGNGVIALGEWEPEVRFPVEPGKHLSKHTMDVMKKIQEKKAKADALTEELAKEFQAHAHALDEFGRRKEELCKYMALIKGVVNIKKK